MNQPVKMIGSKGQEKEKEKEKKEKAVGLYKIPPRGEKRKEGRGKGVSMSSVKELYFYSRSNYNHVKGINRLLDFYERIITIGSVDVVVNRDGEVVGLINYEGLESYSHIHTILVDEAYQGKGIGKKLVESFYSRNHDSYRVCCYIDLDTKRDLESIRFLLSCDFEIDWRSSLDSKRLTRQNLEEISNLIWLRSQQDNCLQGSLGRSLVKDYLQDLTSEVGYFTIPLYLCNNLHRLDIGAVFYPSYRDHLQAVNLHFRENRQRYGEEFIILYHDPRGGESQEVNNLLKTTELGQDSKMLRYAPFYLVSFLQDPHHVYAYRHRSFISRYRLNQWVVEKVVERSVARDKHNSGGISKPSVEFHGHA